MPQPTEDAKGVTRRFLLESADSASICCSTLSNFLELRDDRGALYAAKSLLAYANAVMRAAEMLQTTDKVSVDA